MEEKDHLSKERETAQEESRRLPEPHSGLSTPEVEERLQEYGFNEIAEKKTHPILKFLGFFGGPIPLMIEAAAPKPGTAMPRQDLWLDFTPTLS